MIQGTYIFNGQFPKSSVRIGGQCSLSHGQLLVLKLNNLGYQPSLFRFRDKSHLVLDRILNNQLDDLDRPFLTQSMDSVHCLILDRRIPP